MKNKKYRLFRAFWFMICITASLSIKLFPAVAEVTEDPPYDYYYAELKLRQSLEKTENMVLELQGLIERKSIDPLPFEPISIHENLDLRTPTYFTAEQYDVMLKGTPLFGHGKSFVKVEEEYGVNGLFLVALTGQEQGFGTGELARTKNNLTSYMAYDHDKSKAYKFDSYEHCLMVTGRLLQRDYLSENGKYHKGYTARDINFYYASDPNWANKILQIMERLQNQLISEYDIGI